MFWRVQVRGKNCGKKLSIILIYIHCSQDLLTIASKSEPFKKKTNYRNWCLYMKWKIMELWTREWSKYLLNRNGKYESQHSTYLGALQGQTSIIQIPYIESQLVRFIFTKLMFFLVQLLENIIHLWKCRQHQ